jgi:sugar phosphate isomerase/epimerase
MTRGLAISNIAFPSISDGETLSELRSCGVTGIELAPSKSVPGWPSAPSGIKELRVRLEGEGLPVAALQAILFGISGAALFISDNTRQRLFEHLTMVAQIAGALGAAACVFGAPAARDPGNLSPLEAFEQAAEFFSTIAPVYAAEGTCLTLEANAPSYGCRFITKTREALELVRQVNHSGLRLQIDTGTAFLMQEEPTEILEALAWAGHFHVSEPDLAPIGTTRSNHAAIAATLDGVAYGGWLSIEMRETPDWQHNITSSSKFVRDVYSGFLG